MYEKQYALKLLAFLYSATMIALPSAVAATNGKVTGLFDKATVVSASDGRVFWAESDRPGKLYMGSVKASGLLKVDAVVCDSTEFVLPHPRAFAADGGMVYWQRADAGLWRGRVIDGKLTHWKKVSGRRIRLLAADMGYVYWVEDGSADLNRGKVYKDSLTVINVLRNDFSTNHLLAADRGWLYWKERGADRLYRVRPGSEPFLLQDAVKITTDARHGDMLAASAGHLYWRRGADLYRDKSLVDKDWSSYVKESLNTLIDKGRDEYGDRKTKLILANLDLERIAAGQLQDAHRDKPTLDDFVRSENRIAGGRVSLAGSNLWSADLALIRAFHRASEAYGEARYKTAADEYIRDTFRYGVGPKGGIFWGTHGYIDVYTDQNGTTPGLDSMAGMRKVGRIQPLAVAGGGLGAESTGGLYNATWVYWTTQQGSRKVLHVGGMLGGRIRLSSVLDDDFDGVQLAADRGDLPGGQATANYIYWTTANGDLYRARVALNLMAKEDPPVPSTEWMSGTTKIKAGLNPRAIAAAGNRLFWVKDRKLVMADRDGNKLKELSADFPAAMLAAVAPEGTGTYYLVWKEEGDKLLKRATVSGDSLRGKDVGVVSWNSDAKMVGAGFADWAKGVVFSSDGEWMYAKKIGSLFKAGRYLDNTETQRRYTQGSLPQGEEVHYVRGFASRACVMAAVGRYVYYADALDGAPLYRIEIDPKGFAAPAVSLSENAVRIGGYTNDAVLMAMDGARLFWVDQNETKLKTGVISGTSLGQSKVLSQGFNASALAAFRGRVYWKDGSALKRAAFADSGLGQEVVLAENFTGTRLAAGGDGRTGRTYLYWTEPAGRIKRGYATFDDRLVDMEIVETAGAANLLAAADSLFYWQEGDTLRLRYPGLSARPETETMVYIPDWQLFWDVSSQTVKDYGAMVWRYHVNSSPEIEQNNYSLAYCGQRVASNNRHNLGKEQSPGHAFSSSAGSFVQLFAFLAAKTTGDEKDLWMKKAKCVAEHHWARRGDKTTGLVPDNANNIGTRADAHDSYSSVAGQLAAQLFWSYLYSADTAFYDQGKSYVKKYDEYAYNANYDSFWARLDRRDGNPYRPDEPWYHNYRYYDIDGLVDMWRINMYSFEFPLAAAQTAVFAAAQARSAADSSAFMAAAKHWDLAIDTALPVMPGRRWGDWLASLHGALATAEQRAAWARAWQVGGAYAENYGRAISFYASMYSETSDKRYLYRAEDFAREAVAKLWHEEAKLFRGHPLKDWYQTNDGTGILIYAFLQLDRAKHGVALKPAF